jgi:hypothetical protein
MNARTRQYLFGAVFVALGIYQLIAPDYMEASLYGIAGLTFILNALTFEARFLPYKKTLVILTWIFIAVTGVLFLYMLQFKYF